MKPYISTIPHANSEESFHVYRGSEEALAYRSSWASHEAPEIKALHDTFILLPWEMLFALSNSAYNIARPDPDGRNEPERSVNEMASVIMKDISSSDGATRFVGSPLDQYITEQRCFEIVSVFPNGNIVFKPSAVNPSLVTAEITLKNTSENIELIYKIFNFNTIGMFEKVSDTQGKIHPKSSVDVYLYLDAELFEKTNPSKSSWLVALIAPVNEEATQDSTQANIHDYLMKKAPFEGIFYRWNCYIGDEDFEYDGKPDKRMTISVTPWNSLISFHLGNWVVHDIPSADRGIGFLTFNKSCEAPVLLKAVFLGPTGVTVGQVMGSESSLCLTILIPKIYQLQGNVLYLFVTPAPYWPMSRLEIYRHFQECRLLELHRQMIYNVKKEKARFPIKISPSPIIQFHIDEDDPCIGYTEVHLRNDCLGSYLLRVVLYEPNSPIPDMIFEDCLILKARSSATVAVAIPETHVINNSIYFCCLPVSNGLKIGNNLEDYSKYINEHIDEILITCLPTKKFGAGDCTSSQFPLKIVSEKADAIIFHTDSNSPKTQAYFKLVNESHCPCLFKIWLPLNDCFNAFEEYGVVSASGSRLINLVIALPKLKESSGSVYLTAVLKKNNSNLDSSGLNSLLDEQSKSYPNKDTSDIIIRKCEVQDSPINLKKLMENLSQEDSQKSKGDPETTTKLLKAYDDNLIILTPQTEVGPWIGHIDLTTEAKTPIVFKVKCNRIKYFVAYPKVGVVCPNQIVRVFIKSKFHDETSIGSVSKFQIIAVVSKSSYSDYEEIDSHFQQHNSKNDVEAQVYRCFISRPLPPVGFSCIMPEVNLRHVNHPVFAGASANICSMCPDVLESLEEKKERERQNSLTQLRMFFIFLTIIFIIIMFLDEKYWSYP